MKWNVSCPFLKTRHSSFAKAIPFQMKDFGVDGGGGLGGGERAVNYLIILVNSRDTAPLCSIKLTKKQK